MCVLMPSRFSSVWLSVTLWTIACQTPLSMGLSRQGYWSGLPYPSPRDLPDPGIELTSLMSPALAGGFFTTSTTWEYSCSTWQILAQPELPWLDLWGEWCVPSYSFRRSYQPTFCWDHKLLTSCSDSSSFQGRVAAWLCSWSGQVWGFLMGEAWPSGHCSSHGLCKSLGTFEVPPGQAWVTPVHTPLAGLISRPSI